ncbi:MAG: carbamate kinase [Deltaproteobacteria bacterium]|nr:carbamate kinase [Deltaproteobacteria bacterium]
MAVVALGGHAFIQRDQKGTISDQEANAKQTCEKLIPLIEQGYELVITHGNGPQVGAILHQNEVAKPIGPYYSKDQAELLTKEKNWTMKERKGKGFRQVVPSPQPQKIIQRHMIRDLVNEGHVVIAAGGGGIPIWKRPDSEYEGIDAVIDKDLASAALALQIPADIFIILTQEKNVYVNFEEPNQTSLDKMSVAQAKKYLSEGHFPPGSMGPKIEAALNYLEKIPNRVIITSSEVLSEALLGHAGTTIYP